MSLVSRKILFIYEEVMICVQLPESTIENIKMFIRKVLPNYVNIVLIAHLEKGIKKIAVSEIPPSYLSIIV